MIKHIKIVFMLLGSLYYSNSYATLYLKNDSTKKDTTRKQLNLIVKGDFLLPVVFLISDAQNVRGSGAGNYCSFTVEKLLKKRQSIQLTYMDIWDNNTTAYLQHLKNNNWSLIPEYKFFVSKKRFCSGYYIGIYGKFSHDNYENTQVTNYSDLYMMKYKEALAGGGISNGVQFYVFKKVTVDLLLGLGILKPIYYNETQLYPSGVNGGFYNNYMAQLDVRAAINIGYKF